MKKTSTAKNMVVAAGCCCCLLAGCKTPKALGAMAASGAVALGAAAVQGALAAPSAEEKAAKENPSWVAVAETLTPAQKKAVSARLRDAPLRAWEHWKEYKGVQSGDYAAGVHAEVLRICEEVRRTKVQPCFRWNPPDLEKRWERRLAGAEALSTAPRTEGADAARAEALLGKFASTRMPKSLARYRAARRKAVESERVLREDFPQGRESDPSGGEIYERTRKNAARAVAEMFRRHDELCFFFLMRQSGVFSDAILKQHDDRGGAAWLEGDSLADAEDDAGELPAPKAEDAAFAREHLPESWQAVQSLAALYRNGVAQCRELRKTARALDAARAEGTLSLFRNRVATIRSTLEETFRQFGIFRFRHRIGELDDAALEAENRAICASLRALQEEVALGRWVSRTAKMGVLQLPGGETMDMVWCPPGTFRMGSPDTETGRGTNEPQREVAIANGFWMAKCEVTKGQFESVLAAHARVTGVKPPAPDEARLPSTDGHLLPDFLEVSLLALPTEEEWEYACRAGNPGPYGGTGNLDAMGWYAANGGGKFHPVGGKLPNAWGFHDMHGNVRERCAGEGDPLRGGSVRDRAEDCRSASRDSLAGRMKEQTEKMERDVETMLRRLREEGIDEFDLERGLENLPGWKREKVRKLREEGVIVNPMAMGLAILDDVGFRPVFRPE